MCRQRSSGNRMEMPFRESANAFIQETWEFLDLATDNMSSCNSYLEEEAARE